MHEQILEEIKRLADENGSRTPGIRASSAVARPLTMRSESLHTNLRHGRACPGHPRLYFDAAPKTWMPGTSPGMTCVFVGPIHFTSAHPPSAIGRNAWSAAIVETSL